MSTLLRIFLMEPTCNWQGDGVVLNYVTNLLSNGLLKGKLLLLFIFFYVKCDIGCVLWFTYWKEESNCLGPNCTTGNQTWATAITRERFIPVLTRSLASINSGSLILKRFIFCVAMYKMHERVWPNSCTSSRIIMNYSFVLKFTYLIM